MAAFAPETRIKFVNTLGSAPASLSRSVAELHAKWTTGEHNGLSLPIELVARAEQLLPQFGNREIARRLGISHTSVAKIRRHDTRQHRDGRWRIRRMRIRTMDPTSREFCIAHIDGMSTQFNQSGLRLTTREGHDVIATRSSGVWTPDGPRPLAHIQTGDMVLANGIPLHQDYDWLAAQKKAKRSVAEMASDAGVSYHTIRKWLRAHELQFTAQDRIGHVPWNAGRSGYRIRERSYSADGLARLRAARSGDQSNFWRGGTTPERSLIGAWTRSVAPRVHARFDYRCQACDQRGGSLHAHHVIPVALAPELARDVDNLVSLCTRCHREVHSSLEEERALASILGRQDFPDWRAVRPQQGRRLIAHPVEVIGISADVIPVAYEVRTAKPAHIVAGGIVWAVSEDDETGRAIP